MNPQMAMQQALTNFPEGGTAYGCIIHKLIPDPIQYARECILPRYRQDLGNCRITASELLPQAAAAVQQREAAFARQNNLSPQYAAGRVRLEYERAGKTLEEDVFCTLYSFQSPLSQGVTRERRQAAPIGNRSAASSSFWP